MLSLFAEYLFHGAGLREVEEGNKSQSAAFIAAQRVHTLRLAHIPQSRSMRREIFLLQQILERVSWPFAQKGPAVKITAEQILRAT